MKSPRSLRLRLLMGVLATVSLIWIAVAGVAYFKARHELDELFDAHLAQSASILLAQVGEEADEMELEHAQSLHRYDRQVAFQIWDRQQHLRLHSASAPSARLSPIGEGFSTHEAEGKKWRVFSLRSQAHGVLIQVGERMEARGEVSAEIATHLLAPLAAALPLLGFMLVFAIGRALDPLNKIAREVASRDAQRLEPIKTEQAPAEILPLVSQLNQLFGRIQTSLENERRFTADAAHELRTPIAAIRVQAQVAREAGAGNERIHALDNVLEGCDRATRLTGQLLTLARLDATTAGLAPVKCDLAQAAREVLAELGPAALDKGVALELVSPGPVFVLGDEALMRVFLRNLVDNGVRYSPTGTRVAVRLSMENGRPRLEVSDQGPGIPAEERQNVLRRFYRVVGSEASGSGLGLSIVARIANLYGIEIFILDSEGRQGARVVLGFPDPSLRFDAFGVGPDDRPVKPVRRCSRPR